MSAGFMFRFSPLGEPTARGSDLVALPPYEIASMAVTSRSLNRAGIGMYPLSLQALLTFGRRHRQKRSERRGTSESGH